MTPAEANKRIAETIARQRAEDDAGAQAIVGSPAPGPMREAFSPCPNIVVGRYEVRRVRDGDFYTLEALGHPLKRWSAINDGSYDCEPTGPQCWQVLWILTREAYEVRDEMRVDGGKSLKEKAEYEFAEYGLLELGQLMMAVAKQLGVYAGAVVEYEPKPVPGAEGEKSSDPPMSLQAS
jgi:hypothetical protein